MATIAILDDDPMLRLHPRRPDRPPVPTVRAPGRRGAGRGDGHRARALQGARRGDGRHDRGHGEGGAGTTFWVDLETAEGPVEAHERRHRDRVAYERALPGNLRTVLHVEDNLSNVRLIERILARQHRPDLILLDLHLPDIPGRAVLRQLKADPATRGIPIIVISADATQSQISALTAAGASGYLTKPLDLDAFLGTVSQALQTEPAREG